MSYSQLTAGRLAVSASSTLVALLMASQAWAAGFQLQEQNARHLGTSYAGTAATADEASTAYYNPAGITRIPDHQLVIGGAWVHADNDFNPTFASNMAGTALALRGEENSDKDNVVPFLHYTAQVTDDVFLGLSVVSPFGLAAEYSENSVLRYMATRSELKTIDISPSIAYRVNKCLSVAAGADILWAKAHLDLQTSATAGATLVDGFQRNTAEEWGYGYHLAVLWELSERTRFGINYRSHVKINADGESEQVFPTSAGLTALGLSGFRDTYPVHASVTLPSTLYISAYHAFTDEFAVMADVNWTDWSRFRTLRLRYDAPVPTLPVPPAGNAIGRTPTDTFEHWDDSVRVALGMEYTPCEKYQFRFGVAWDQTPVDTQFRTARIPDADRFWVGVGVGYALSKNMKVDLGYAHLFFKGANIDEHSPYRAQTTTPSTAAVLRGKFDTSVDIFGVQFRWTFA